MQTHSLIRAFENYYISSVLILFLRTKRSIVELNRLVSVLAQFRIHLLSLLHVIVSALL